MEERSFHPLDYVSVLRRRKWWFIVPAVLCTVAGAVIATMLPREYRSEAEIGVAAPTLSPDLLRGVQSIDRTERVRAISQQLLSRTVLERVVREERLGGNRPVEDVAAGLRSRVEQNIVVPRPIGNNARDGIESFRLGWVDSSPDRAQRIANRLAMVFVEENSKTKTQRLENTSEVLGQQLRASQERLTELQEQLRVKKEAYMGRLPDQTNANLQMVNNLQRQQESLSMQLRAEQDRLSMVEAQIDAMRQGGGSGVVTSYAAGMIQTAQNRIRQLQQQLTQYRAMGYTDQHPDIVQTREELVVAQGELAAARQQTAGSPAEVLATDPIYKQRLQERSAAQLRLAQLNRELQQTRAQIASYQARVEAAPMVEQELAALTQDVGLERDRYAGLAKQHQDSLVVEDLARREGGERFVVLNPAYLPTRPFSPDITRLMLMAVALGFALGVAGVVGREFMDRSVHDARALTEFDVPVLGEIPRIHGVA
jgi:polysaccharide biosynthesis transport protein